MSLESLMIHTVDIETEAQTKSVLGGNSTAGGYDFKAQAVPCRVTDQKPDDAKTIYGKYDALKQKRVYFTSEQNLTIKDRIIWNGGKYYVVSVQNAGGNLDRLWQVDVEKRGT